MLNFAKSETNWLKSYQSAWTMATTNSFTNLKALSSSEMQTTTKTSTGGSSLTKCNKGKDAPCTNGDCCYYLSILQDPTPASKTLLQNNGYPFLLGSFDFFCNSQSNWQARKDAVNQQYNLTLSATEQVLVNGYCASAMKLIFPFSLGFVLTILY